MAKAKEYCVSEDEKAIVKELKQYPRESIDKISRKCSFSRQKVSKIIRRLEGNKTIWGYHTIIDNEKFGMGQYTILVKQSPKQTNEEIQKIIDLTIHKMGDKSGIDISCSSYLHGRYDWIFVFTARDIKNAKKFSMLLSREYPGIFSEIQLLEDIFPVKKFGFFNPELESIKNII